MTHAAHLRLLLKEVRGCTICAEHLPQGPRPVLQADARARILIAGQAPGSKVHSSGVPFDDASGERLRQWMGLAREQFYDPELVAILPMGFCYPGAGSSGDLPPRKECAAQWRARLLQAMPRIELTLVIGQYAMAWHLPGAMAKNLTETVRAWREKSCTLSHASSAETCRLTAPCDTCSSPAACVKLAWRDAASKARNALSGGRRLAMIFPHG